MEGSETSMRAVNADKPSGKGFTEHAGEVSLSAARTPFERTLAELQILGVEKIDLLKEQLRKLGVGESYEVLLSPSGSVNTTKKSEEEFDYVTDWGPEKEIEQNKLAA